MIMIKLNFQEIWLISLINIAKEDLEKTIPLFNKVYIQIQLRLQVTKLRMGKTRKVRKLLNLKSQSHKKGISQNRSYIKKIITI